MKKEMAKRMAYIGAGTGLVLFVVFGLFPGSLVGGVMGLNVAGGLFGAPVTSALLPRLIVGMSMLAGVLVSGIIFVSGTFSLGWLVGRAIDSARVPRAIEAEAKN